jgi:hypothetical protein
MRYVKQTKKVARVVGRTLARRYTKGKRGGRRLNVKNIYQDVQMLKHLVNTEKKRFDVTVNTSSNFAQLSGAGVSGQYAAIITPYPNEGVTQAGRIGNSLKIVSACIDIQFAQQSACVNKLRCRWYIVCRPDNGTNYTAATSIAQFFEPNPFSGVNDAYSSRDPEFFTAMKIIKQGQVVLTTDSVTNSRSNQQVKIPLKLNHHLKFNSDATNITVKNQFYLFIVASDGDTTANTGAAIVYNCRWYFTDN